MNTLKTLAPCCALAILFTSPLNASAQPVSNPRSIDGTGNNLFHSDWGSTHTALPRTTGAYYPGDGTGTTFYDSYSPYLPNPRDISNKLYDAHGKEIYSAQDLKVGLFQSMDEAF